MLKIVASWLTTFEYYSDIFAKMDILIDIRTLNSQNTF